MVNKKLEKQNYNFVPADVSLNSVKYNIKGCFNVSKKDFGCDLFFNRNLHRWQFTVLWFSNETQYAVWGNNFLHRQLAPEDIKGQSGQK